MLKRQLFEKFMCLMIWLLTAEWIVVVFFWKRERERMCTRLFILTLYILCWYIPFQTNPWTDVLHCHCYMNITTLCKWTTAAKWLTCQYCPRPAATRADETLQYWRPLCGASDLSAACLLSSPISVAKRQHIKPNNLSHTLNTLAMSVAMALQMHRVPVSKLASRSPP